MLTINLKSLYEYKTDFRTALAELVSIPSVKGEPAEGAPFGKMTVRALDALLKLGENAGFASHREGGYYGWLEWGEAKAPIIAAVGHLDVVPAGAWAEAFELHVEGDGDTVLGRGVADDKGPVLAAFYALKFLKDQGYRPRHRFRLIAGLDEESGSRCLARYNEVDEIPRYAFTPDADFPVISAEKGLLHVEVQFSDPLPFTLEAGTRANVVPGEAILIRPDGTKVLYSGRAAHASTPEEGINAISLAMGALAEARADGLCNLPLVKAYHDLIGSDYSGRKLGIACSDQPSGALTLNVGLIKAGPTGASLTCDIRYPVTADAGAILKKIEAAFARYGARIKCTADSKPLYLPLDHPLVKVLGDSYGDLTGLNKEPIGIGGGTYARALPNTVAFGAVFPGEPANMHQTGEIAKISSLLRAGAIYAEAFQRLDQLD